MSRARQLTAVSLERDCRSKAEPYTHNPLGQQYLLKVVLTISAKGGRALHDGVLSVSFNDRHALRGLTGTP